MSATLNKIKKLMQDLAKDPNNAKLEEEIAGMIAKQPAGGDAFFAQPAVAPAPTARAAQPTRIRGTRRGSRAATMTDAAIRKAIEAQIAVPKQTAVAPLPGTRQTWSNAIANQNVQPLKYFTPSTLAELMNIVQTAEKNGLRVRAVGSGHAFSDIAVTNDYLVGTDNLGKVANLHKKSHMKASAQKLNLVEVEAGIKVKALNLTLDALGLGLHNAGGSDVQAVMGAVSTGTHGSGIGLTSYPDFVRSCVLVTTGGKAYRVEPKNGITDPAKYKNAKIPLVQNDDWFYSVLLSMGSMGIVYSVTMEVDKAYWLTEKRQIMTWDMVRPLLVKGDVVKNNRHFEVIFNPYKVNGKNTCIVTTRNYAATPGKPKGKAGRRNFLTSLLSSFGATPKIALQIMNAYPNKIPEFLDNGLRALEDAEYTDKSYKVLNQGLDQLKSIGYATEIGFPADNYLPAVDRIFTLLDEARKHGEHYVTSPVAIRYVKQSPHYMSMMYGTDTVMIEMPMLNGTIGGKEIMHRFQDEMYKLGGRPHWGLEINLLSGNDGLMEKMYPKYKNFQKMFDQLNVIETFHNAFTDRLGFSKTGYNRDKGFIA